MIIDKTPLLIDYTSGADLPIPIYFWKAYETGVAGVGISHAAQGGCESPEVMSEQHVLFLHLRPELSSERRIDDRCQVENVQIGDVAILPAHASHWQGIKQEIAEAVMISLEPRFLAQSTCELANSDSIALLPTFAQPDPLIYGIGLTLKNALETRMCDRIYAESLLTALSVHLLRRYSTHQPILREYAGGLSKYKLKQAIAYIQAHLAEDISLEAIATELEMSRYYFCHLFKQSTGISPHQYVIKCRIDRAKELLLQGHKSIADVALQVGFTSQSHFTKHFKRIVGVTPKQISN